LPAAEDGLDQALHLLERGGDRRGDRRLAQGGDAIVEIGLAAQLVVVELELLAGLEDGGGSRSRTRPIADRGLQPKGTITAPADAG
jgi:hypothetical protein